MAALTENVLENLTEEQLNNLKRLGELADRETQACKETNDLFRNGRYMEGGAIVICEDMDDLNVTNMFKSPENQHPVYRELIEVKGEIRNTLEKSLNLGLGYLGLIQRQCANYHVEMKTTWFQIGIVPWAEEIAKLYEDGMFSLD